MAGTTEIANMALQRLGEIPIQNLNQNCKAANAIRVVFEMCRDIVLADHPWNFAMRRATLARLSQAPEFGYSYAYQLPPGCLRVWGMVGDDGKFDPNLVYEVEGSSLLTNESSAKIRYIFKVEEPGLFSIWFCSALAARIAMEVGFSLTQDAAIAKAMADLYQNVELPAARSIDAQEGTPQMYEANPQKEARR